MRERCPTTAASTEGTKPSRRTRTGLGIRAAFVWPLRFAAYEILDQFLKFPDFQFLHSTKNELINDFLQGYCGD